MIDLAKSQPIPQTWLANYIYPPARSQNLTAQLVVQSLASEETSSMFHSTDGIMWSIGALSGEQHLYFTLLHKMPSSGLYFLPAKSVYVANNLLLLLGSRDRRSESALYSCKTLRHNCSSESAQCWYVSDRTRKSRAKSVASQVWIPRKTFEHPSIKGKRHRHQ